MLQFAQHATRDVDGLGDVEPDEGWAGAAGEVDGSALPQTIESESQKASDDSLEGDWTTASKEEDQFHALRNALAANLEYRIGQKSLQW